MVFESLVVELINKYFGDFVENLDRSQLKIGIWKGNVKLQNLDLKESALNDLNQAVKIKTGHIEKLTLKIPWKNLYREPLFVSIDGFYVLAVPNVAMKYNAEKEENDKQESKQKKLLKIEEAKKAAAAEKGKEEGRKDSLVEKMIALIIKNLEIQIKNIHFRYEDCHTNPNHPFSIGVNLEGILFQTIHEKYVGKETVKPDLKRVEIDSLAVYWNSGSEQYASLSKERLLERLGKEIAGKNNNIAYQYLLKPITSKAHLKLNMKPKLNNFSLPKVFLNVFFDDISIGLSKEQYNGILMMLESFERMHLMSVYRKYRPEVPLHGHAKTWWHFARDCVLEEKVRRRRRMFSWNHIIHHRNVMKRYKEAYSKMLSNPKKVSQNIQNDIQDCETFLDVFSITLMRSQADVTAAKCDVKKPAKRMAWLRRLFKRRKKKTGKEVKYIKEQFKQEFTAEEKAKLYEAIGYEENEVDPALPREYVAVRLETKFKTLSVTLNDNTKAEPLILVMRLNGVNTSVEHRPADSSIQVNGNINNLTVVGSKQKDTKPEIVMSQNKGNEVEYTLLNVKLETNPFDRECDTRVIIKSRPLQIVYDAVSVNNMTDFFKPPKDIYLKQFSRTAYAKFEDIKRQSASGLRHAIEQHKYTEVRIDIKPSYVIIPHGGCYKQGVNMLVLDLGNLIVSSEKNSLCDEHEPLMLQAYNKFVIRLDRVQILFAKEGEDWESARLADDSLQHVLLPISLKLCLQKSMFANDQRLPKFVMSGDLPLLSLNLSDLRLQEILLLAQSIPLPDTANKEVDEPNDCYDVSDVPLDVSESQMIKKAFEISAELTEQEETSASPYPQDVVCRTLLLMKFEIKEVSLCLHEHTDKGKLPMITLVLQTLGSNISIRKYDMNAEVYLGGISVQHPEFNMNERGSMINMLYGPTEKESRLLSFTFHKADLDGPDFESKFKKTEQEVDLSFTTLELLLHQESLLRVMKFTVRLQQILQMFSPTKDKNEKKKTVDQKRKKRKYKKKESQRSKKKEKGMDSTRIILHASAKLMKLRIIFRTKNLVIAKGLIKEMSADVVLQDYQTVVTSKLREVTMFNSNIETKYPKIVEIKDDPVLDLHLTIYNNATANENYSDMSCVDAEVGVQLRCIKVVFLMRFFRDLLEFFSGFQVKELESQIQMAKDKVREASEAITAKAKIAMAHLAKKSPRVAIKVSMSAPVILVPQHSNSLTGLMLDLGHLNIRNSFSPLETIEGNSAVQDSITINLHSMKIARVEINSKKEVVGQCLVLEPVTVSLSVKRNLAYGWFKEIPAVYVSCQLESIKVNLGDGDYRVIMRMLTDNLAEGKQLDNGAGSSNITDPELDNFINRDNTRTVKVPPRAGEIATTSSSLDQYNLVAPHTQLQFLFQINSLSATLYSGERTLSTEGEHARSAEHALGQFMIEFFEVKGEVKNDKSIAMSVILRDTIIDDTRRQNQKIGVKRMLERIKNLQENTISNMVCLEFIQDCSRNIQVNAKVCSIRVVICPNFLMPLFEFFTKRPSVSNSAIQTSDHEKSRVSTLASLKRNMLISISIDEPEIILIEDQMDPASNSLLVSMGVEFGMRVTQEFEEISASVKTLQIASAIFNKRDKRRAKILNDCDISFYSMAPCGKLHHIDIATTNLVFNISPQTIRTSLLIAAKLSKLKSELNRTEGKDSKPNWKAPAELWNVQKISEQNFWFLSKSSKKESTKSEKMDKSKRGEQMIINIPNIIVKLEGGVGKRSVPLLIAETSFDAQIKDWSSKLEVKSNVRLEVSFYNENLSEWEPVVEPVLENGKRRKWDLEIQIIKNDDKDDRDNDSKITQPMPPKRSINIRSSDPMEVTVTKTCLVVLNHLVKAFGDAYKHVAPAEEAGGINSPYVIKNTTGLPIILTLDTAFETLEKKTGKMTLETDTVLPLNELKQPLRKRQESGDKGINQCNRKNITFKIWGYKPERQIEIKGADMLFYPVVNRMGVVCSTEVSIGQKTLHFRSIVQMKNNLPNPVEVFSSHEQKVISCGVIEPGEILNIPLAAVYALNGYFLLEPKDNGCEISKTPFFVRKPFCKEYIECTNNNGSEYIICAKSEVIRIYMNKTENMTTETYLVHLSPPVMLHNFLNFSVKILLQGIPSEMSLEKDESKPLIYAVPDKTYVEVEISEYQNMKWCGRERLSPKLSRWKLQSKSFLTKSLNLGVQCKDDEGCLVISLYSPYLMFNRTGMTLYYKDNYSNNVIQHLPDKKDMALFSFEPRTKISLRIADSDWSDMFSLDTVNFSGSVQCKLRSRIKEVGVTIRLSSSGLTKICTFTPFYILMNSSDVNMWVAEANEEEEWIELPPKSCMPFWPVQSGNEMTMSAKVEGSKYRTKPFNLNKTRTTLMRINDWVGGIYVQCQVTQSNIITTLTTYKPGMATVLMINSTDKAPVKYNQSGEESSHVLNPMDCVLYTWENAIGTRELSWSYGQAMSEENNLIKDGSGSFFLDSDTRIYWVSFLDGLQRVLLFTEDPDVVINAHNFGQNERFNQEIKVSLHSIGVSLVNDTTQKELVYLGITSSGVVWERKQKKRYKAINTETAELLETAYQAYIKNLELGHCPSKEININDKLKVNFEDMEKIKLNDSEIRRSVEDGMSVQYKTSPHQRQFQAKVYRVQLDNQTNEHKFHTYLASVPPNKSVTIESVVRPFVEVSIYAIKHKHSNMLQIKNCTISVQEITLKVDKGFLKFIQFITPGKNKKELLLNQRMLAIKRKMKESLKVFTQELSELKTALKNEDDRIRYIKPQNTDIVQTQSNKELMEADLKTLYEELIKETGLTKEHQHFFDSLQCSPIKINFSLSLKLFEDEDSEAGHLSAKEYVNLFFRFQDFQDVVLRLGCFERENILCSRSQVITEICRHYMSEAKAQKRVLLLGGNAIGNPYGLVRGVAEGVKDLFNEPIQGIFQGKEEFRDGLTLGVRSMVGHTIGGAAGTVSRITGTIGKRLAELTFDDKYQKKRTEEMRNPGRFVEGMVRRGKGLGMGIVDGAKGIIRKPKEGARNEGVGGFFKDIGMGLVDVLARSTGGIVDIANISFEQLKRTAERSDEVERLRPARRFYSDKIIRPYNLSEAVGYTILQETEFAETDVYVAHAIVQDTKSMNSVLLVTNRQVIYVNKVAIGGQWDVKWSHTWSDFEKKPIICDGKLEFLLKDKNKLCFLIGNSTKSICIPKFAIAKWLVSKISLAMEVKKDKL